MCRIGTHYLFHVFPESQVIIPSEFLKKGWVLKELIKPVPTYLPLLLGSPFADLLFVFLDGGDILSDKVELICQQTAYAEYHRYHNNQIEDNSNYLHRSHKKGCKCHGRLNGWFSVSVSLLQGIRTKTNRKALRSEEEGKIKGHTLADSERTESMLTSRQRNKTEA